MKSTFCSVGRHTDCINRAEEKGIPPYTRAADQGDPCKCGCHTQPSKVIKLAEYGQIKAKDLNLCISGNGHRLGSIIQIEAGYTHARLLPVRFRACSNCGTMVLHEETLREYMTIPATEEP